MEEFSAPEERAAIRTLEELLREQDTPQDQQVPSCIKKCSQKFPSLSLYPPVELFVKLVTKLFESFLDTIVQDNLTKEQCKSLKHLRSLNYVVYTSVDKGGNFVIWSKKMYEAEVYCQLRDQTCYKKLTFNPLSKFQCELHSILHSAVYGNIISKDLSEALRVPHPVTATLCLLPKVHKNPTRSPDLLQRIKGIHLEPDTLLVTCDIESLYTSIRHTDGLTATKFFLTSSNYKPEMHIIKAVPYGQYLRARRICSSEENFKIQADDLRKRFRNRSYSNHNLKYAYNRAKQQSRYQLLQPKQKKNEDDQILQDLRNIASDGT
ncbi:uncharacterized protein LOC130360444 [Hyla sarda]|uniref:uncharacterized protein LOC130360444 n=1 Tax=Hyla sarda TaxID=327740 RepID=UPI0024C33413|nr:uncharacterized protein LOC130360444 [Hyla sarda]